MDIKKAIEYALVALKLTIDENKDRNREITAKQLSSNMWLSYYMYDDNQIHCKVEEFNNNLELK